MQELTEAIKTVLNDGLTKSNGFQKRMGVKCIVVFCWLGALTIANGLFFWWVVQQVGYMQVAAALSH